MDLLWIANTLPSKPPTAGTSHVIYNRLRHLSERGHNVHLLLTTNQDQEPIEETVSHLSTFLQYVDYVRINIGMEEYIRSFRQIRTPYNININHNEYIEDRANHIISNNNIDIVFIDHIFASGNSVDQDVKTVLGIHNLEARWFWDNAKLEFPNPKSIGYCVEAARMRFYEKSIYRSDRFSAFEFVSRSELQQIEDQYPSISEKLHLSPIGININRFKNVEPASVTTGSPTIVFSGSMNSRLNIDAVNWFTNEIFGEIKEIVPDCKFLIVGHNPTEEVKRLTRIDGVKVTGRVNRTEPYIVGADLVVIPLRGGAGVKIKLLEALAAQRTILTTDHGISGTKITPGEEVLQANSIEEFTQKAIRSLENPDEYKEMRRQGTKYVEENHSWENIIDDLESDLFNLLN